MGCEAENRRIRFEGISNARDLGGIRTADGKTIRSGWLIRSANLSMATDADVRKLREQYHLALVIDLRTAMAEKQKSDVRMEGVRHRLIPIFDDAMIGITHENDRDYARRKVPMPDMRDLYRMMVREPSCRDRFKTVLEEIMKQEEGAALWHCSEGKDRCGLTTAFLLTILGADWDSILEDYLMTNETALARAEAFYRKVLENGADEKVASSVRDAFVVKEAYLEAAREAICSEFGSLEEFIMEGLGVSKNLTDAFRRRMLV